MNILIIQENGRHEANRDFRECHALSRSFKSLGHDPVVWGLGHAGFPDCPDFNRFDLILNLENYDQSGWLPDLSRFTHPIKMIWAVDEHARGEEYYRHLFERDGCRWFLHSTLDYVRDPRFDVWLPNAVDPEQVKPIKVPLRADVGFCGNTLNRREWLDLLKTSFKFQEDSMVIGEQMVRSINSYRVAFNRNISHDINARSFEVPACGVPLVTNFNPVYLDLGFKHRANCIFYQNKEELIREVKWLLENEAERLEIAQRGLELSKRHTYTERAREILSLAKRTKQETAQGKTTFPALSRGNPERISIAIITNSGLPGKESRKEGLRRLLESIRTSGIPSDKLEILIAGAVGQDYPGVRVLELPDQADGGHVSRMRNALADVAQGDLIIHCDDDIIFTPGYWVAIVPFLEQDWDILCTKLLNPDGTRYWDWAAYVPGLGQTLLPYDVSGHTYSYATGGHALYRRSVYNRVRWDESITHGNNEELKFAVDARKSGMKYRLCANASVFLQTFHCDAAASAKGTKPSTGLSRCPEFTRIISTFEPVEAPEANVKLWSRMGHKLGHADTAQSATEVNSAPTVSILVCCHRFLQRFRIFAQTLCAQEYPLDRLEIAVANPESPDGLSAYLKLLNLATGGKPKFIEVPASADHYRNRGYLIQRGFEATTGEIVIGMDGDLVLPTDFLKKLIPRVQADTNKIIGVYRQFLKPDTTAKVLAGMIDPVRSYADLAQEDEQEEQGYRGVLGYCQALPRETWAKSGYPEEFDSIAKSDIAFIENLAKHGVTPLFIPEIRVLHLNHTRNWDGTTDFL